MSQGIGSTQQKILAALHETAHRGLTTAMLAGLLNRSMHQVRVACDSLESRGLVNVVRTRVVVNGRRRYARLVIPESSADQAQ